MHKELDMFVNMRQFLTVLWTFELLLHFDQLFSSSLQSKDKLSINLGYNYLSENVLCSTNDKIVTEIYLKSLGAKKDKKVKLAF